MMKTQNKKRGFTIIELVIVVTVIAILSAVLIPVFAGVIKNANLSADKAAVRSLNTMIAESEEDFADADAVIKYLDEQGYDLDSYVPASKDYSFVWSAEKNMIMIYSEEAKAIVFPDAYAGKSVAYVTLVTDKGETAVEAATVADLTAGGNVAVKSDIVSTATITLDKPLVLDLTGTISAPSISDDSVSDGVFKVVSGATLTLNGNGTVNAVTASNYHMAIWANGGDVVINGGTYTNEGATQDTSNGENEQIELIYVKNGSKVTINGGSFKCANPEWTINVNNKDQRPGTVVIAGGEFFEFDPSADVVMEDGRTHAEEGIIIAEGYEVVEVEKEDGTWYKVQKKAA